MKSWDLTSVTLCSSFQCILLNLHFPSLSFRLNFKHLHVCVCVLCFPVMFRSCKGACAVWSPLKFETLGNIAPFWLWIECFCLFSRDLGFDRVTLLELSLSRVIIVIIFFWFTIFWFLWSSLYLFRSWYT